MACHSGGMLSLNVKRGMSPTRRAVRDAISWIQDHNGNFRWSGIGTDKPTYFGAPGHSAAQGNW